jgi:cellulose synthase/poly-beta-1,6-N-acetylglucosamine synthase-like glycosyltransferase
MLVWLLSLSLAVIAVLLTSYLLLLTLLSFGRAQHQCGNATTRFAFVVPAHNEESSIAATVRSLAGVDYAAERRSIHVVADNCTDATASAAAAAGARVLERRNLEQRGKGYALELAFSTLLAEGNVDAVVVVDADSTVSADMLRVFDAALVHGARAVQARYGVRNVNASWRTRLMAIALGMFHDVRSLGRERLGVSCGLRGNGMCFTAELLRAYPHRAYGLVEDVEYGIALGLAGVRVHYAHDAEVLGEMASTGKSAASQRQRWEGGRSAVRRKYLGALARRARHSRIAADLACDLLMPPLSQVVLLIAAGLALEGIAWLCGAGPTAAVWLWAISVVALAGYVLRGVTCSGLGARGFVVLAAAPLYIAWKVARVARGPATTWVRTARENQQ